MNKSYLGSINKYSELGYGSQSNVYMCDYLDSLFAYKEFWNPKVVEFIKDRLFKLSEYHNDYRFVFPYKFIYEKATDENFIGYIMDCLYKYEKLSSLVELDYYKKIDILKKSRHLLYNFHKDYNSIHTDICPWNIMYNLEQDKVTLIDFDTYIDLNNKPKYLCDFYSIYSSFYADNVGIDKDLDIFLFNLTTYSMLTGIEYHDVLKAINNNELDFFESSKVRDIFKSYKNIECNKSLKKEYVIDYL